MGSKSKIGKRRQVDFSSGIKMLSELSDQKQLQYTKEFTTNLASIKVRMEALEDILIDKLGITEALIEDHIMLRVEKNFGYKEVDTEVKKGSIVRLKIKEEIVGKESPDTPMDNQYICVGHNQIHAAIDTLVIGAKAGDTRDVTLPDPKDAAVQRKLTVSVTKVFKGEEAKYETPESVPETQETPQAAQN